MYDQQYSPPPTDQSGLWIGTDQELRRIVELLRPTGQQLRCWWCRAPLTGPTCPRCDAGSAS